MRTQPSIVFVFVFVSTVLETIGGAGAQVWPTRPVTMVVPSAAGSSGDVLARILAPRLSELLGQQVIVENVGGAGGMTAVSRVAKAAPDGYQFVRGDVGSHAMNQTLYRQPLYNAAADFEPVALIAETPLLLVVRKDLPVSSLSEFAAYVKANHDKMQYGSAGAGSSTHLACVLLNATIGVKVTHIPYRGGGPAMQDLVAGRIDYQCPGIAVVAPQIESKNVKAIAILAKDRSQTLPALPSAHEQGLSDFEAGSWYGFFLPKGTPAPIVRKLNEATVETLNTPSVQQRATEIGFIVAPPERRTPQYLQNFVESEIAKWAGAIKASGVTLD
jgi:tripartite-type tricarboxylate transporter receptor subunit TctC